MTGPKHSAACPRVARPWSVTGTLLPAKPSVPRRLALGALEWFILLCGTR